MLIPVSPRSDLPNNDPSLLDKNNEETSHAEDGFPDHYLSEEALNQAARRNFLFGESKDPDPHSNAEREGRVQIPIEVDSSYSFKNIYKNYRKRSKETDQIKSLQNRFLKTFEYLDKNINNIIFIFRSCASSQTSSVEYFLDIADNIYEWANCVIPFSTHCFSLYNISLILSNLDELDTPIHDGSIDLDDGSIDSSLYSVDSKSTNYHELDSQEKHDRFRAKLTKKKMQVWVNAAHKSTRIMTKTLACFLSNKQILSQKIAEKVGQYVYKMFSFWWNLSNCFQQQSLQKEWVFHLQSPLWIDIEQNKEDSPIQTAYLKTRTEQQENLQDEINQLLTSLKKCQTIEEVQDIFNCYQFSFNPPRTYDHFTRQIHNPLYQYELSQSYCQIVNRRLALNHETIDIRLKTQAKEHQKNVERCIPFIKNQVENCRGLPFKQVCAHFAKMHIPLNKMSFNMDPYPFAGHIEPLKPYEIFDCNEAILHQTFLIPMAEKWIEHQETTAQLVLQGVRQALLSKHEIERKFLIFQSILYAVQFAFTTLSFALHNPLLRAFSLTPIIEFFIKDISKLGLPSLGLFYVGYPLYPELKLKLTSFLTGIAQHIFAVQYKPNEYSFEGYKLTIQLRMTKFILLLYSLKYVCQYGLLSVRIELLEKCISGLNQSPLSKEERYNDLDNSDSEAKKYLKDLSKEAEKKINELKTKDSNHNILPSMKKSPSSSSQEDLAEDENFGLGDLFWRYDEEDELTSAQSPKLPIDTIVDALINANVDYFPFEVIVFFETHLGFKLTEESKKKLKEHLEMFLSKEGGDFVDSFAYLRSIKA